MTTPAPEPTLADVLQAISVLSVKVDDLATGQGALALKVEGIDNKTDDLTQATADGFAHVMNELSAIKADVGDVKGDVAVVKANVAEVKVEMGLLEARVDDAHRAILRHANDPNAHPDAA